MRKLEQAEILCTLPFYAKLLQDCHKTVLLSKAIEESYPKFLVRLARRSGTINAFLGFWHVLRCWNDIVVTKFGRYEIIFAIYFDALFRPSAKRFLYVEFIPSRQTAFQDWLYGILIRRTAYGIQVLSPSEREDFARRFNLPADMIHFIPWFYYAKLSEDFEVGAESDPQNTKGVVSSGHAACDWETLFRAAEGRSWPLTVICGKQDLDRVSTLNRNKRADVLCNIPLFEHDRHVASAAVYVLALQDIPRSCGQIRLCKAVVLGVPVVATRVRGLEGYCVDGETALLVDPEDPDGLREAIEKLLADEHLRDRLVRGALARAKERTSEHYAQDIRAFVLAGLAHFSQR